MSQLFNFDTDQYVETLTTQTHDTLNWLLNHQYLTVEQWEELTGSLVVAAIPNRKGFGIKILERFFGKRKEDNVWVFPIVKLDPWTTSRDNNSPSLPPRAGKPVLTVVKDEV